MLKAVPVIEVEELVKRYGDRTVVDRVSFAVDDGEILAIIGPNGAGKTTIVESIEGLRRPDGGRIRVLGLDPLRDGAELKQRMGAQLQESQLPDRIKVWRCSTCTAPSTGRPRRGRSSWSGWA